MKFKFCSKYWDFTFSSNRPTGPIRSISHYVYIYIYIYSKVRGEYKVAVYNRFLVPSLRYHLTVHNVHKTHLEQLDMAAQRYLKQWLGIPARGCTSLGVFSPAVLGTKPVSQVYLEGHKRDPHKFLGAVMTHLNTPQDHYLVEQLVRNKPKTVTARPRTHCGGTVAPGGVTRSLLFIETNTYN